MLINVTIEEKLLVWQIVCLLLAICLIMYAYQFKEAVAGATDKITIGKCNQLLTNRSVLGNFTFK